MTAPNALLLTAKSRPRPIPQQPLNLEARQAVEYTFMDEPFEPNFFQLLREEGPLALFVVVVSVGCTLWLLISRIRGCFRSQPTRIPRDFAFLLTGPITAILYSIIKAMIAAQVYVRGGIDSDFLLTYGLRGPTDICVLALVGFVLGVIAFTLPTKPDAKI